jgi:hypothetical protein
LTLQLRTVKLSVKKLIRQKSFEMAGMRMTLGGGSVTFMLGNINVDGKTFNLDTLLADPASTIPAETRRAILAYTTKHGRTSVQSCSTGDGCAVVNGFFITRSDLGIAAPQPAGTAAPSNTSSSSSSSSSNNMFGQPRETNTDRCAICKGIYGFMGQIQRCACPSAPAICGRCQHTTPRCPSCDGKITPDAMVTDEGESETYGVWFNGPYTRFCPMMCGAVLTWDALRKHVCGHIDAALRKRVAECKFDSNAKCPVCTQLVERSLLFTHIEAKHGGLVQTPGSQQACFFEITNDSLSTAHNYIALVKAKDCAASGTAAELLVQLRSIMGNRWSLFVTTETELAARQGYVFIQLKTKYGTWCRKLKCLPQAAAAKSSIETADNEHMAIVSLGKYIQPHGLGWKCEFTLEYHSNGASVEYECRPRQ